MLRRSFYLTALIAALTTFIAVLARSQSLPTPVEQITPHISAPSADAIMPVCYIQLENGQLRDLRSLCGKNVIRLVPSRGVPRSISQPNDTDDDESAPTSTPTSTPRLQPSPANTPSPPKPVPQPTVSPSPGSIGRPANVQPSPANPSTIAPTPHPLAIPENEPSRN